MSQVRALFGEPDCDGRSKDRPSHLLFSTWYSIQRCITHDSKVRRVSSPFYLALFSSFLLCPRCLAVRPTTECVVFHPSSADSGGKCDTVSGMRRSYSFDRYKLSRIQKQKLRTRNHRIHSSKFLCTEQKIKISLDKAIFSWYNRTWRYQASLKQQCSII